MHLFSLRRGGGRSSHCFFKRSILLIPSRYIHLLECGYSPFHFLSCCRSVTTIEEEAEERYYHKATKVFTTCEECTEWIVEITVSFYVLFTFCAVVKCSEHSAYWRWRLCKSPTVLTPGPRSFWRMYLLCAIVTFTTRPFCEVWEIAAGRRPRFSGRLSSIKHLETTMVSFGSTCTIVDNIPIMHGFSKTCKTCSSHRIWNHWKNCLSITAWYIGTWSTSDRRSIRTSHVR